MILQVGAHLVPFLALSIRRLQMSGVDGDSAANLKTWSWRCFKVIRDTPFTGWWLNQPIWKICSSKWVHLPQIGVKIPKIFELPPPSLGLNSIIYLSKKWSKIFSVSSDLFQVAHLFGGGKLNLLHHLRSFHLSLTKPTHIVTLHQPSVVLVPFLKCRNALIEKIKGRQRFLQ